MGFQTRIEWCDHTWNPWRGCEKISEGCDHCYAAAMSVRNPSVLGIWTDREHGEEGTRPQGNDAYMRMPFRWDREHGLASSRGRVFCGSLMDIWEDREELLEVRQDVLTTSVICDSLDWLFLTKRPQNIEKLLKTVHFDYREKQYAEPYSNWWLGCTVENLSRAKERIDVLRSVPAAIRFLSVEPLLEPLDLCPWLAKGGIHWVIVGGESSQGGAKARCFDTEWAEEIVTQCRAYKIPVFVKQMGSRPIVGGLGLLLKDRHGGNMEEWPEWLRVRELPK